MAITENLAFKGDSRTNACIIFDGLDVSEATRKEYAARIGLFLGYVEEHGLNLKTFLSFKRHLESRTDYRLSTRNKYLVTARVFLKELARLGMLPADITHNVSLFRESKRHKREGFSETEVMLMRIKLGQFPDTPQSRRLRALFCLLTFQGLRQIEIVRLDVGDVDIEKQTAFIRGKGEDEKELIYLAPETVKALKEYLRRNEMKTGALFKSMGNRKSERISTMTIRRELGRLFRELAYEKSVHGFRHFYITTLLKSMNMRDVRKFSRHRSLEMLMVYDDETDLKEKASEVFRVFERFMV